MNKLERQLHEDRQLRNSARDLLRKEWDHARREMSPPALSAKVAGAVGAKTEALKEGALAFTENHWRKAAAASVALLAGTGVWLARKPILSGVRKLGGRIVAGDLDKGEELERDPLTAPTAKDANDD